VRLLFGGLLGAFFVLGSYVAEGGHMASITQRTALLRVAGGALSALIIAYPLRTVVTSFLLAFSGRAATRSQYLDAARVFRSFGDMALLAGFLGVLLGAIRVIENLDKPEWIGPNAAIALIDAVYGLLLKLFVGKALADSFEARAQQNAVAVPGGRQD